MSKPTKTLPIKEASSREIHTIEYVACLEKQLFEGDKYLKDRLKLIPNGWRDFRLATKTVERLLTELYKTVPNSTRLHMQRVQECGQVIIRPHPAVKPANDTQIVILDDLLMLVNTAMAAECAVCLKDAREQKKCKLRKALMNMTPPKKLPESGLCVYADVAAKNELGKYI